MSLTEAQSAEIAKYYKAYTDPGYRMKDPRKGEAEEILKSLPYRDSYLDVSAGRGQMTDYARSIGFKTVMGTEVVPSLLGGDICYALAWDLPFGMKSFEVVSLFDVLEHILPGDDEFVCKELARVASKAILLTANNHPSYYHINCRPYEEWHALFTEWFAPGVVSQVMGRALSKLWRVDF